MHRTKCFECGLSLDNALRSSLCVGLDYYVITEQFRKTVPPFQWPLMKLCCDEGSDGKAAFFALQGKWNLNIIGVFDPNHGLWNSIKGAMKAHSVGLWSLALLSAIAWNMPHLPYSEDRFFYTIKGSVEEFFQRCKGLDDGCFTALVPRLLRDRDMDGSEVPDSETVAKIFEDLQHAFPWFSTGERVSQNRFLQFLDRALKDDRYFNTREFGLRVALGFSGSNVARKLEEAHQAQMKAMDATTADPEPSSRSSACCWRTDSRSAR